MDANVARVLITTDTLGGVWTYALELAGALDRRGLQVALVTMGARLSSQQRTELSGLGGLAVYESSFKLEWMQDAWEEVDRAGQWLLAIEREWKPDVVHLNQLAFGALPFAAPKLVVAHSCVLSWWHAVHGEAAPSSWDEYRRRVEHGLDRADLIAAPTQAMLRTLVRNYGCVDSGRVLGNGRSPSLFKPGPKQPLILGAGRLWDEGKNLGALQAVAPQLPWPVRLAGSVRHPDGGSAPTASALCLGELTPRALARHLSSASIYALPARYEPFGLSVLEAALCECALVLGDIASLRELWGATAVYVAPNDHDALGEALRGLIADPERRLHLARAARERALRFTPEQMADDYLAAYAAFRPGTRDRSRETLQCA